jgi:hypothetical protein
MNRWLRVVWPPWWAVVLAGVLYVGIESCLVITESFLRVPPFSLPEMNSMTAGIIGWLAAVYAVYRVWAVHPALRPGYYQWLWSTPWTDQKPLPLGPIHLVLQDALLLAVMVGMAWPRAQQYALGVVSAFLFTYLILLGGVHFFTGARWWAYAMGVGVGCMIWCGSDPPLFVVAAGATYLLAYLGLRASLSQFPWPQASAFIGRPLKDLAAKVSLGWPYHRLGPPASGAASLRLRDALLTGAVAGWWCFALMYRGRHSQEAFGVSAGLFGYLLVFGFAGRLICYGLVGVYMPPISLVGRLAHGRWIIPNYDQAWVAPILVVVVGLAAMFVAGKSIAPAVVVMPVAFTLVWWILFGMGPSLQSWRLTGNHRIAPGLPNKQFTQ